MPGRIASDNYTSSPQQSLMASGNMFIAEYDDDDQFDKVAKGFILSADATIKFLPYEGNPITFTFPKGTYSLRIRQVFATGTNAAAGSILCLV